jgi:hypothetical protein
MFEVLYTWYMLFIGKIQQIYLHANHFCRIPGIPSSILSFQVFLDRLFRFARHWNWLSPFYAATSRTTIAGPAE